MSTSSHNVLVLTVFVLYLIYVYIFLNYLIQHVNSRYVCSYVQFMYHLRKFTSVSTAA